MAVTCFAYDYFTMEKSFPLFADVSSLFDDVSIDTASMGTLVTPSGRTGGELRKPPSYSAEENIRLHIPIIYVRWFVMRPVRALLFMYADFDEQETAFACWLEMWKHWDGRRDPTAKGYALYMDVPNVHVYEKV